MGGSLRGGDVGMRGGKECGDGDMRGGKECGDGDMRCMGKSVGMGI